MFLDSVDEGDASAHKRKQVRSADFAPALLGHIEQLESHGQRLGSTASALGHALTKAHGRKRRLDRVGRS